MITSPIVAFNAGELSPWLDARVDLDKYRSGLRTCENWLLTPYGGIRRRPGTKFIAELRDMTEAGRLIPFRYSTAETYILSFNDGYIRVYSGGDSPAQVGSEIDTAVSTGSTNPYLAADLFGIQVAQQNDVLYLVHPSYPVRKLTRTSTTTFALADVDWSWGPMREQNLDEAVTIAAASINPGAGVVLTGTGTSWTSDLIGTRLRIDHERKEEEFEVQAKGTGTQTSSELLVQGTWTASIAGSWATGEIAVQRWDDDAAAWQDHRKQTPDGRSISMTGFEDELVRMRVQITNGGGGTTAAFLTCEGDAFGEVLVTGVASTTSMTVTILKQLYSTDATSLWQEGAFSDDAGYPAAIAFHEGRLVFGGTTLDRQTIWGSKSDDYENFKTGTDDDDSYRHALAAAEHNAIRWMVSERRLVIGTSGGEFVVGSADDAVVVTPNNVRARRHSNFGSDSIQALFVNDSVIYAQRHGRKLREYGYSFERDRYQASDLTILAEHITGTGLKEIAFQQQRDAVVWGVTEAGDLVGLTYERDQAVVGWHRHTTTNGTFEAVETVYGEGEEDEIWVVVKRTISGSDRRYIERMDPKQYQIQQNGTKDDFWYVDCGGKRTGAGISSITIAHLANETVEVLADGVSQGAKSADASGVVTIEGTASTIIAGLKMTSKLESMVIEAQMRGGTSRTREVRINRCGISLWQSMGGQFAETLAEVASGDPIQYRDTDDSLDDSPELFTGDLQLECDFDWHETGAKIAIMNDSPYAMGIRMLVPKFEVGGND